VKSSIGVTHRVGIGWRKLLEFSQGLREPNGEASYVNKEEEVRLRGVLRGEKSKETT